MSAYKSRNDENKGKQTIDLFVFANLASSSDVVPGNVSIVK